MLAVGADRHRPGRDERRARARLAALGAELLVDDRQSPGARAASSETPQDDAAGDLRASASNGARARSTGRVRRAAIHNQIRGLQPWPLAAATAAAAGACLLRSIASRVRRSTTPAAPGTIVERRRPTRIVVATGAGARAPARDSTRGRARDVRARVPQRPSARAPATSSSRCRSPAHMTPRVWRPRASWSRSSAAGRRSRPNSNGRRAGSRRARPRVPARDRRRHAALAERARRLPRSRRSRRPIAALDARRARHRCASAPISCGISTASRRTPSCTNRSRSSARWAHPRAAGFVNAVLRIARRGADTLRAAAAAGVGRATATAALDVPDHHAVASGVAGRALARPLRLRGGRALVPVQQRAAGARDRAGRSAGDRHRVLLERLRGGRRRRRARAAFVEDAVRLPAGALGRLGAECATQLVVQEEARSSSRTRPGARPGERVLDVCAAPGGKTAMLAADDGRPGPARRQRPSPASRRAAHRDASPRWA